MFFNANKSLTKIYIVKEEILQLLVFPHLFFFGLVCVEVNLTFGHCEIWSSTLKLPLEILLNQKRKLMSNYRKLKRAHDNNAVSVLTDIMICPSIHIYSWKHISSVLRHWLMQKLAWWSHRKLTSVAHNLSWWVSVDLFERMSVRRQSVHHHSDELWLQLHTASL